MRRYAAIPSEQLPGISRWSVLLGALVSLDGVWRSTGAVVLLRPSEGDSAAEWVHEASVAIAKVVAGKRGRRPSRRREPDPHGVLVAIAESLDPQFAALMSKLLGSLLPAIAGEMWRRRAAGPKLTNTDGHRLRLITARVAVNDPAAVAARLVAHADFRTEAPGRAELVGARADRDRARWRARADARAGGSGRADRGARRAAALAARASEAAPGRHLTTAERGWSTKGPPHRGAGKAKSSPGGGRGNNKDDL